MVEVRSRAIFTVEEVGNITAKNIEEFKSDSPIKLSRKEILELADALKGSNCVNVTLNKYEVKVNQVGQNQDEI